MSETVFLITVSLFVGSILLIFGMKYASAAYQLRSQLTSDRQFRELADSAVAAQAGNTASLTAIQSGISEIRVRLGAIEKILKEVE